MIFIVYVYIIYIGRYIIYPSTYVHTADDPFNVRRLLFQKMFTYLKIFFLHLYLESLKTAILYCFTLQSVTI